MSDSTDFEWRVEALRAKDAIVLHAARARVYWLSVWEATPDDTKLSVGIGMLMGFGIIVLLAVYPGEPFDYRFEDGNTETLQKVRDEFRDESASKKDNSKKDKVEGNEEEIASGAVAKDGEGGDGLRRRRKNADAADTQATAFVPADEAKTDGAEAESAQNSAEPEFVFDEQKWLAKSARAERLLGIPQDKFKQAILDAKREFEEEQQNERSGKLVTPSGEGASFVSVMETVLLLTITCIAVYYVNRDYGGMLGVWMKRAFPRESRALGLRK